MRALEILSPTAKSATNIEVEDQAGEVILAAFRTANSNPKGSSVVSIPMDVAAGNSKITAFSPSAFVPPLYGPAPKEDVLKVAKMIDNAKLPVLFLGQRASSPRIVEAVRSTLKKHPFAVVETFQAAGAIPEDLAKHLFYGRVGIFRNQTGDRLLQKSDLIITLGYDPTEYDAQQWNPHGNLNVVHVDYVSCDYGAHYNPKVELLGSVRENILAIADSITHVANPAENGFCQSLSKELRSWQVELDKTETSGLVQPLRFVSALQKRVSKDTTVTCDVGTVYIYMMRYFLAYEPRKLLCSNGQQTLGVGMPWAIAASLVQDPPCSQKVVSLSGDGGFMFSSQELSTAVQQGCNITVSSQSNPAPYSARGYVTHILTNAQHFIWNDEHYNMVEFQEEMKYGRSSGIALGGVDFVKFAESFGAKGFRISDSSQVESIMDKALAHKGVSLVDVKIDYSHAKDLAGDLIKDTVG